MKIHRLAPGLLSAIVLASGVAHAAPPDTGATEGTVRLDSRVQVWVSGDDRGPAKVGKNTGAGIMDASFTFDRTTAARAAFGKEVLLGTVFTRSATQPNGDGSYMQGGFAFGKITDKGIELGKAVDLPVLDGERAFMRPLIGFTPKFAVLIAASEDNDSANGNPKPVMFLVDKATGQLVTSPTSKRGAGKPLDLITVAQADGIAVDGANDQRGPHTITAVDDSSFLVGMQYNNQAQEVFRVTVPDDGNVKMNWLQRYSNNAVHNRPSVAYAAGAAEGYVAAVECNAQPANIGLRLTKFDVATGKPILSKVVVKAEPDKNKYVAEPHIMDVGDKIAMVYALSAKAREKNGNNGHAGGANVSQLGLFAKADLAPFGETLLAPANYQRHPGGFAMKYGSEEAPAIGVISGSSTGTSRGLLQVIPLKEGGALGAKDAMKMYAVSTYSDVANLQARGKRNPNNQAKGFINGVGDVPNPGFDKPGGFYPEVKTFSFSTVTGFSSPEAATKGLKESLWLSLVPATWKKGLATTPGATSETAGNAPAARVDGPGTNEGSEATSQASVGGAAPSGLTTSGSGGCAVGALPGGRALREGFAGLAFAALVTAIARLGRARRARREEVAS
jgi:hypothetical protein